MYMTVFSPTFHKVFFVNGSNQLNKIMLYPRKMLISPERGVQTCFWL